MKSFFVNRALYKISSPKRGDVIVFKTSASDSAALHIRRVIGLPGETVQIKDGKIYINGKVYEENGAYQDMTDGGLANSAITLESGEYFVLGDNRNNSEDSRFSDIGNISKSTLSGKIWFTVSPKNKIGFYKIDQSKQIKVQINEVNYERTVVSRPYDEGEASDAGRYQADRSDH